MADDYKIWKKSLPEEIGFWDKWFQTKGLDWPKDYFERLNPDSFLSNYYTQYIDCIEKEVIDILDVGAGPLTILGKKHPSKTLNIVAVDTLAHKYDKLLRKYRISPPIRTIYGEAEKLDTLFEPNCFDLVTAINCIDHAYDPLAAVSQMLRVVRKDRIVFLSHQENEGEVNNYQGLHQYNLTAINGDFCVKTKYGQVINVTKEFNSLAIIECQLIDHWLNVIITKI